MAFEFSGVQNHWHASKGLWPCLPSCVSVRLGVLSIQDGLFRRRPIQLVLRHRWKEAMHSSPSSWWIGIIAVNHKWSRWCWHDGRCHNRYTWKAKEEDQVDKRGKNPKEGADAFWVRGMTLENVVLNANQDDVESLGPKRWFYISAELRKEFLKANKIQVAQSLRNAPDLGKNVAN